MLWMHFVLTFSMKGRRHSGAIDQGRTRLGRLWEAMLSWLGDGPVKVHTTSRPRLSQIQPEAPSGPIPHLLSTPMAAAVPTVPPSLQSDGCQTPYPSQEEMYLGTRSLGRVHVAAFIGCEWNPTEPCLPLLPLPHPFQIGVPS